MTEFSLKAYDYILPPELIAKEPVSPRDASRLMVIDRAAGKISHHTFRELPSLLQAQTVMVANHTRVIAARLLGTREGDSGPGAGGEIRGKVEALLLKEVAPWVWECSFKSSAKQNPGLKFSIMGRGPKRGAYLKGEIVRGVRESGGAGTVWIRFDQDPTQDGFGHIPLPHYMDRPDTIDDVSRYQTVYAKESRNFGSAAAPTAGFHFTEGVLEDLKARGHDWTELELQVGLGTFRPVKTDDIREHQMHSERYEISDAVAKALTSAKGLRPILAVGTTTLRALESAWDASLQVLRPGARETDIFFYPGGPNQIRFADQLLTNFHLPGSTLLMLVSAFAGRELIRQAYELAVKERYRFFSYGDAMWIR